MFNSLISFKEENEGKEVGSKESGGKEIGAKEGVIYVIKEWMALSGRKYFGSDEKFLRFVF